MFDHVAHKLKLCSIIYFFGNILHRFLEMNYPVISLDQPVYIDIDYLFKKVILYLLVSIFIYCFGEMIKKYEKRDSYRKSILSQLFKLFSYLFFIFYILKKSLDISINLSYFNTGQILGVESMILIVWAIFIAYLIGCFLYGIGIIIQNYENHKIESDVLTK